MDIKKCKGCGIELQSDASDKLGYVVNENQMYCQRCYRIMHYNDLSYSMKNTIDQNSLIQQLKLTKGTFVWIIDAFDFESGLDIDFSQLFLNREIILVLTKIDLLPDTLSQSKLMRFVKERLKKLKINACKIFLINKNNNLIEDDFYNFLLTYDKTYLFIGKANAGKSTLINRIINANILTCSLNPGTTLALNRIDFEHFTIYDTPGLLNSNNILLDIDDKDLKKIVPLNKIRPQVFQIYENQSFAIAGLARIDVFTDKNASVVFYNSRMLNVHRGKIVNADAYWLNHYSCDLKPRYLNDLKDFKKVTFILNGEKSDIVIAGLGWICLNNVNKVDVYAIKDTNIIKRKAMI